MCQDRCRLYFLYPLQQCKKRITTTHTLFQLISEAKQATELEDEAIEVINDYIDTQAKGVGVQYIETQEDIENHLDTLRQQLMKAEDNNEKIRIK